jgi:hypothetical protein
MVSESLTNFNKIMKKEKKLWSNLEKKINEDDCHVH